MEKETPVIDLIVTHYDEPWSIGKKFFDMLAMQRNIDFSDIRVILVQDGKENALPWKDLLNEYPYKIKVASIPEHRGVSTARNAGLQVAEAEWVMFCDFDDMFADVVSIRGILQVLPTDDADVIWMRTYREERVRATKRDNSGVFVNCLDENFYFTHGKLYKRAVLNQHGIRFDARLKYEYESVFNHIALSVIPPFRVMGLTVDFLPYMKTLRNDSYTMRPENVNDRIEALYHRDLILVDEYKRRNIPQMYYDTIAETIFDMYYILGSKPTVRNAEQMTQDFAGFYREHRAEFEAMSQTELEVVLDNCINKMLGTIQNLYNYNGIETEPPYDGMDRVRSWLKSFDTGAVQPPQRRPAKLPKEKQTVNKPLASSAGKPYDGQRVVIYCGTYNTYVNMISSAKSLLAHTKVDKIYFLTEDDEFPYEIPDIIENINVKSQRYFPEGGPNFDNVWSYMCMMRAAFPSMFPQYDRALSLDIDIIINEDIGHLWDLDLTDYYYAGVPEPCRQKTSEDPVYCNFGVIMMNLDKLRRDGKDREAIDMLNTSRLGCPEQDAFNKICAYHILPLPPDYNYTPFSHITGEPDREIITHYAGLKYWKHFRPVRQYAAMTWKHIMDIQAGRKPAPVLEAGRILTQLDSDDENGQEQSEPQDAKQEDHMPRIAFMFGTRDWYHRMALSLKSLLKHTYMDKVYFMIEDDFFPEPLPPFVQCVNVSNQQFFPPDGPNYQSMYSYMVLLRAALPIMFPDIDLALSIDADTLTSGDIGGIWDTDMSHKYLAAVKEMRALHGADYYNAGVMLMNFANLRRDKIPEQAIKLLNEKYFRWKEQDVLNDFCRYHIAALPRRYNYSPGITGKQGQDYTVRHYIGGKSAKDKMMQDAAVYEDMSWNEIVMERGDRHE